MRGLYAIVDVATLDARRIDPLAFTQAVLKARPAAVQLRAKDLPAREILALLRALAPMCHGAGVPLVANDRADLAVLAGCDLVHVGQEDIGIDLVRRIAPGLGIGVSTHDLAQLQSALASRPSYVAFGPVFPTRTKANPDPVTGLPALRDAARLASAARIPLVAIGGITLERVADVAAEADCAAVALGLVAELPEVRVRAEAFQAAFAALGALDRSSAEPAAARA